MNYRTFFASALLLITTLGTGCGGSMYQASQGTRFEPDSGKEINDDDVRKAFDASPQIGQSSRVAYYTFDDEHEADIEKMLAATPHVTSVYKIPPLLVTGQRPYQENYGPPQEVSMKKLRLLAARAHADVLVVFDHGYKGGGVNPLVAFNVLLVPALFTPWLSNETDSYAQAFVFDVRNGYLYADMKTTDKAGDHYVTIYGRTPQDVANDMWPKLLSDVQAKVAQSMQPTAAAAAASSSNAPPAVAPSAEIGTKAP